MNSNYRKILTIFLVFKYTTRNIFNISDSNNPYIPICNRLNRNNVNSFIIVVIIVTFMVYFA